MSRLTMRNLGIATVFLLIAVAVFVYGSFVIEGKNQLLKEQITALEKDRAQEATYRQMQRTSEESRDDRVTLQGSFLDGEGDSIAFLNTVESLARDAGIALTTEELKKDDDKRTKEEWLTTKFSYSGSYSSVTGFLETLENLQYVAEVTRF